MEEIPNDTFVNDFLANLLKGNRAKCSSICQQYLKHNPSIQDLYEELIKVSLYKVGQLWETNQITVATEHIATAISEGIMNELYDRITTGKKYTKKVVVACVDNEHHQVGIKMVADVFEMNGWDSFFPGSGIPTSELVKFIHEIKPDILAISLSVYFNFANLLRMLESLRKEFPELPIILGGMAFTHISGEALNRLENIVIMKDLYELSNYIDSLNANFK